jgi:hypothetical protein
MAAIMTVASTVSREGSPGEPGFLRTHDGISQHRAVSTPPVSMQIGERRETVAQIDLNFQSGGVATPD